MQNTGEYLNLFLFGKKSILIVKNLCIQTESPPIVQFQKSKFASIFVVDCILSNYHGSQSTDINRNMKYIIYLGDKNKRYTLFLCMIVIWSRICITNACSVTPTHIRTK